MAKAHYHLHAKLAGIAVGVPTNEYDWRVTARPEPSAGGSNDHRVVRTGVRSSGIASGRMATAETTYPL
jgi:hypothetical protein